MPEVLSIDVGTQVGLEVTSGTGVAANKKFQGMQIVPSVGWESQRFQPSGYKFATIIAPIKEWAKASLTGFPTYDEIIWPLSSIMGYAAPAQQGATAAYKWTHELVPVVASTVKTFTVEHGDAVRAWKFEYGAFTDFGLNFSRNGVELSGSMIGEALQDGITLTAGPTIIPAVPILPTQVDIKLADTQAGIAGATALTRAISAGFNISSRFNPFFPLTSTGAPGLTLLTENKGMTATATLKLEADATGMGLLTQMRAGSSKFMQIKAVGGLAATGFYYTMDCQMALKVSGEPAEFSDEDGIYAIEWPFEVVYDATWTKSRLVEVTNTQSTLT